MPLFLAVSFGLAWALAFPIWASGGDLNAPNVTMLGAAMMFAPSFAVLAVFSCQRWNKRVSSLRDLARTTGLTLGIDRRRTISLIFLGWVMPPILVAVTGVLAVSAGLLKLDFESFSLLRERLGYGVDGTMPMSDWQMLVVVVLQSITVSALLTMVFASGEEWGWRGWMLPRLVSQHGTSCGLILSGVIWGIWHFPLTLLGYNYPDLGAWAALLFVPTCVLLAVSIGWLRLVTGSIWPAVAAHGSLNASAGLIELVGDAAEPPAMHLAGIGGLVGWVVLGAIAIACLRHLRTSQAMLDACDEHS